MKLTASTVHLQNTVFDGTFSYMSNYMASSSSRDGRLKVAVHQELLNNDVQTTAKWLYIGRLNTTISSQGTDECGSFRATLTEQKNGNFVEVSFTCNVKSNGFNASHEFNFGRKLNSQFVLFRNDDSTDANKGDLHLFVQVPSENSAFLSITRFVTGVKRITIADEGNDPSPRGNISLFDSSWTRVYNTDKSANSTHSIGSLQCNLDLTVGDVGTFEKDIVAKGNIFCDKVFASEKAGFNITSATGKQLASFSSTGNITYTSLLPVSGSSITIGNIGQSFAVGYIDDMYCKNMNGSRLVTKELIGDHLTVNKIATVEIAGSGNLNLAGHLSVNGNSNMTKFRCYWRCTIPL